MRDGEDDERVSEEESHDVAIDEPLLYSTTEGRQNFPNIMQTIYGEKLVVGFGRYGRAIGAAVPIEAIRMLAGFDGKVDATVRRRIMENARLLLAQLPRERAICGLRRAPLPELVEMEDIEQRRAALKSAQGSKRKSRKRSART